MNNFFELSPESILDAVDSVVDLEVPGLKSTGRSLALNSLENRVYDVELEDNTHVVTKFYRPGRWTAEQIQEEHNFLFALEEAEIPVVTPWIIDGQSLFEMDGIYFALFRKVRGRLLDELDEDRLLILGRYIARIHNVGENFVAKHRLKLNAKNWAEEPLAYILQSGLIGPDYQAKYKSIVNNIIPHVDEFLQNTPSFMLHGDCHLGNTLWQNDSPFFLDFDDAMIAPPLQDIWMVVRGRGPEADEEREILLEGYETFRPFDRRTLSSIEVLRALRMIHYSAWIAKRWDDPSFPKAFPLFSTPRYWEEEINSLQEIVSLLSEQVPTL